MGLDMYLKREHYVKNWDHNPEEKRFNVTVKMGGKAYEGINSDKISSISEEIMYWRKFNALHNWIITNCALGVDECQLIDVSKDELIELYNILKEINVNRDKAEELLPTASGFFFGGTDYDDYYFDEVKRTIEELRPYIQDMHEKGSNSYFVYQASW
jgi:hypothetical protein